MAEAAPSDPVAKVPNEPRWSSPRRSEISCPPDPSSPDTATLAVSYAACDVGDAYETFVMQILGDLLTDGAAAPFYTSLLESGLGTAFAPVTGELVFHVV